MGVGGGWGKRWKRNPYNHVHDTNIATLNYMPKTRDVNMFVCVDYFQ